MRSPKFRLNRRAFLRGVGTTGLALPFLESIPHRSAFAQGEVATFGFYLCTSCGVVGKNFWPGSTGPLTTESLAAESDKAVSILADHADRLLIINGVNYPGNASGCAHADGLAKCLTAGSTQGGGPNVLPVGPSCDFLTGQTLGVSPLTLYAGLKGGYIEDKLSFDASGKVRSAEGNPYSVYLDLAGLLDMDTGEPAPVAGDLVAKRKSVNDLVSEDLRSLMSNPRLSYEDKQRLQLHLDSIRDLENTMMATGVSCGGANLDMAALEEINGSGQFDQPFRADGRQEDVVKLQMELTALAFACNSTRVASLQAGDGTDGTRYTIDGELYERFHYISHRINGDGTQGTAIANAEEKHARIDRLRMESFKHGLDKWAQYSTPTGPLLDNAFVYWTSHVSDGPSHSFKNLPIIIAGNAGGYLKQGQYINAGGVNNGRVLATLMTANGAPTENFGDGGGGILSEMLANG